PSAVVTTASGSVEDQDETVSQAAVTWKKAGIEEYSLVVETVKATKNSKKTTTSKKTETTTETSKKSETTTQASTKASETETKESVTEPQTAAPDTAAPAAQEDEVKDCAAKTMYTAEKVNLRNGPSLNDSVISVLSQGCELLVTGYTDDWYRVKADGVNGYCMKRYLTETAPVEEEDNGSNSGVITYSDVELNMLCYVLQGEVGDCSEASKIAVANVIINRVKNPLFPDSIEGVLTQSGQFDAIWGYYNGSTVPSDNTIECAKRALAGEDNVGEAVYYYAPQYCSPDSAAWFESLTFCAEIDGQRYFM
ncbi:MAG: cell wall hydrolase, partial [Ruminococcus sp.]|nr:cell wall hydrolase [Ruminococcus sp.]